MPYHPLDSSCSLARHTERKSMQNGESRAVSLSTRIPIFHKHLSFSNIQSYFEVFLIHIPGFRSPPNFLLQFASLLQLARLPRSVRRKAGRTRARRRTRERRAMMRPVWRAVERGRERRGMRIGEGFSGSYQKHFEKDLCTNCPSLGRC